MSKQTNKREINEFTFNLLSIYSGAQGGKRVCASENSKPVSDNLVLQIALSAASCSTESIAFPLTPSLLALSFLSSFRWIVSYPFRFLSLKELLLSMILAAIY